MAEQFPQSGSDAWTQYKHANENKLGLAKRQLFPPAIAAVTDELNSPEFVAWISELTGIAGLKADPMLEGGGLHQSGRGGYLNVHTDFSMHHFHPELAPPGESDSVSESGVARGMGRGARIVGKEHGSLRSEVSAAAESCADFYDRRAVAARFSRSAYLPRR